MENKYFNESSVKQKCEFLKTEVEKLNNRIDKQIEEREADKGVAFVLLPFILMFGYNIVEEVFNRIACISDYKIAFYIVIWLILLKIYKHFYNRIKK